MILKSPLTFKNNGSRFEIKGNKITFDKIVSDMFQNAGKLAPSDHWNWKLGVEDLALLNELTGYTDELFVEKYSRLDLMLNPLVGVTGMKPIDVFTVDKYEKFLRSIDIMGLLPYDILEHGKFNDWRETDLGSVIDANLINAFIPNKSVGEMISVCEVGGGYGRLAEVLLTKLPYSFHYILLDAVPGSLMYSYMYLKKQLPNLNIGSYYEGDKYRRDFDCYIMPSWHADELMKASFDICINIESMQEMEQHHVDHYLKLFDQLSVQGGLVYLSNARDYVFRGDWKIPKNWQTLLLSNTPRSWTANHPTHVLVKKNGDFSQMRMILEGAFNQQVISWVREREISDLEQKIVDRERENKALLEKMIPQDRGENK